MIDTISISVVKNGYIVDIKHHPGDPLNRHNIGERTFVFESMGNLIGWITNNLQIQEDEE